MYISDTFVMHLEWLIIQTSTTWCSLVLFCFLHY